MKPGRLEAHLKAKNKDQINSNLNYFQILKKNYEKRATLKSLFTAHNVNINRVLDASYQISLRITKSGKNHTIGEQIIKPSISTFIKTVFAKDDRDMKTMPLCNNTVSRRIDELSKDVEIQLIEKLKTRLFSVQMDESTLRDSKAVLLTYVRYIENNDFAEEIYELLPKLKLPTRNDADIFKRTLLPEELNSDDKQTLSTVNSVIKDTVKSLLEISGFCAENCSAHVDVNLPEIEEPSDEFLKSLTEIYNYPTTIQQLSNNYPNDI
ncbi:protein FAM200B-like [Hydra vulgaris]|uniref:Protein FAM200B-like n=1 Tax=Hydra vulgaris TaxID=6087 RepID=A0ABM4CMJ1_HYDVU